jgi:hypothetical protein
MKTKSNVQKTILRSVAVITSLVLLSFTVGAQGYWKKLLTNKSFNEIATALVENTMEANIPAESGSNDATDSFINMFYLNNIVESDLELEDWMISNTYFGTAGLFFDASESNLILEAWMVEGFFFQNNSQPDESVELEAWMTKGEFWTI